MANLQQATGPDKNHAPADTNFATGPSIGAADLISHVNGRLATCPDMKFVLVGYSQGAMVTGR